MATVFKRTRKRPMPAGAEIITYRGRQCASWTDKRTGRKRRAPLADDGKYILVEDAKYSIEWFDHTGKRRRKGSGTVDKDAALQLANELETKAMQRREGIIDAEQERFSIENRRSLSDQLSDFEAAMRSAKRTDDHIERTVKFVREIADAAGFVALADITADGVNRYASGLTNEGKAARTVQARLTAIKSFTKWLTTHDKLARDPLASVKKPNPKADRRRERRMLLPDEWTWLRSTADSGPERFGMTGRERMLLYAVAIQTGLRSGECRSLTRGRLYLDTDPPYITAKAGNTKNRKDARQYIQTDLAAELKAHIATKAPKAPVFAMPHETNVADMFRQDLADARRAWLKQARKDPEEHTRREQSDFLQATNHEGEKADFHSLRHTTGAWLALAGVHPKVVQTVMRHSTITLTMDTYGHLFPGQEADAVASLPSILGPALEALAATGTDGTAGETGQDRGQHLGQQLNGKPWQTAASGGETSQADDDNDAYDNSLQIVTLDEHRPDVARSDESRPGGIRTPDQGIMSLIRRLRQATSSYVKPKKSHVIGDSILIST